jgi:flavin reductase (DIM6/NTAB) family NADH-FMN oxidoreductase RutF/DNA-binding FadR family transcriptional regulator
MPANDTAAHDLEQLTKDQFRDVIGRFASGVTVITITKDGKPLGATASAFTSLSDEPPMILICMNKSSETGMAIHEHGNFAVNILGESHPDLAMRFAGKGADKFEGVSHETGANGGPLLVDALATLECTVTEETSGGTHLVFLASVDRASAKPGTPLTYFRGKFGRFHQSEDEAAYNSLRAQIIERRIEPGKQVDLDALSEQTSIDRNTLYHALAQLSNEGLVERTDTGGFEVVAVTAQLMEDWIEARGTIEIGVAMQRSGNIAADEVAECERLLAVMEDTQSGPVDTWINALNDYLNHFVSLSGSPSLLSAYKRRNVATMIANARRISGGQGIPPPPPHATETHRRVLKAMQENNLPTAFREIQDRTDGTVRGLRAAIEDAGGEI